MSLSLFFVICSRVFLKKTSAIDPPQLIVPKYSDPLRTDKLPEGEEQYWTSKYADRLQIFKNQSGTCNSYEDPRDWF